MSRPCCSAASCLAVLLFPALTGGASDAGEIVDPSTASPDEKGEVFYYDVRPLGVEGQGWPAAECESPFNRLPAKAKDVVRQPVWNLGRHSAGLCLRFVTDASAIHARWTVTGDDLAMRHMPATGVSGLDLYVKTDQGRWRWLAVGEPTGKTTTAALVTGLSPGKREYLLYLPLYNGVSSAEVGVPEGASLWKAPPRPAERSKPIVFYGTSITQGACASRPGMCHTAILGRRLDRPVINLGFSGNGFMEPEVAALLAELDPAVFVIDCLPNLGAEGVAERTGPLLKVIRAAHPDTPIVLVEDRTYPDAFLVEANRRRNADSRAALRKVYEALVAAGEKNLYYLPGEQLLAEDGEDTVDGSHPTDMGFVHHADAFQPVLEQALGGR